MMNTEVLVTGAGPVGLAMAAELVRYGVTVRIVDKAPQRTDKSKALVIWSRTLELLDRAGCSQSLIDAGFRVTSLNIAAGEKQLAHVSLEGVASPHPYGLMLPQSETERLLEQHLHSFGVQVERSVELAVFTNAGDQVVSTLRHADGRQENVETPWLIGCDGAHSTVRHQLGMEFRGDTLTSDWVLADVHLSGLRQAAEIKIAWHAEGVLAIFPISRDRFRIVADVGNAQSGKLRPDPTLQEVQAILDRRGPGGVHAFDPIWLAAFRINERKVKNYRAGRVFLAGDAAHIHSPAGGQGMNTGIQDACNLAWKLSLVCRGVCSPEPLLGSYSIERSAVGEQVLKAAGRMTTIGIMRGEIKQSIRNHVASLVFGFAPVQKAMAEAMTEVSIEYRDSPLSERHSHVSGGPDAGDRAQIRSGERPVGAGNAARFVLFAEASDVAKGLTDCYPDLLEREIRVPFGAGGVWLVRPDGYVAVAAREDKLSEVATFLDKMAIHTQIGSAGTLLTSGLT